MGAAKEKDPWLAVNLSWTVPGLGQLYARQIGDGCIYFFAELILWTGWYFFLTGWLANFVWLPVLGGLELALRVVSCLHVHGSIRVKEPPEKNPWRAFFFTRLLPGLGHAYAGRWVRAPVFFLALIATAVFLEGAEAPGWMLLLSLLIYSGVLADSFLILRKYSPLSKGQMVPSLILLVVLSQPLLFREVFRATLFGSFATTSSSMSPTIDEDDYVVMNRLSGTVERFDVVAFRFPLNRTRVYMKRVIGLPGEEICFEDGELYVREKDAKEFAIARKDPSRQAAAWAGVAPNSDMLKDPESFEKFWTAEGAEEPGGYEVARGGVRTFEKDGGRSLSFRTRDAVHEVFNRGSDGRISLEAEVLAGEGRFTVRMNSRLGSATLQLLTSETSYLEFENTDGAQRVPLRLGRLQPGRSYRIDVEICDGVARAWIDGDVAAKHEFVRVHADLRPAPVGTSFAFGARNLLYTVRNLRLYRDIHYAERFMGLEMTGPANAVKVPADSYFLVGDNTASSWDSRNWKKHTFYLKDLRTIVCEAQEIVTRWEELERIKMENDLKDIPSQAVRADINGKTHWFEESDIDVHEEEVAPFVPRANILGKVLRIWWPPSRARQIP